MGNLVDVFIIVPKPEWNDHVNFMLDDKELEKVTKLIENSAEKVLFNILAEECTIYDMLSLDSRPIIYNIFATTLNEIDDALLVFTHRYRGKCLQQTLKDLEWNLIFQTNGVSSNLF